MFTKFEKKVWQYTKRIPLGRITTYRLLAKAIGYPKASRAVGNALNKNPHSPQVPCHRVVRSNGEIGGYAKGRQTKIGLLGKEGIKLNGERIIGFYRYLYKY